MNRHVPEFSQVKPPVFSEKWPTIIPSSNDFTMSLYSSHYTFPSYFSQILPSTCRSSFSGNCRQQTCPILSSHPTSIFCCLRRTEVSFESVARKNLKKNCIRILGCRLHFLSKLLLQHLLKNIFPGSTDPLGFKQIRKPQDTRECW
jgi:hypothetical protein